MNAVRLGYLRTGRDPSQCVDSVLIPARNLARKGVISANSYMMPVAHGVSQ